MQTNFSTLVLHMTCVIGVVISEGFYTIVAPGTLHSGRPYSVAITIDRVSTSCRMAVSIESASYKTRQLVTLNASVPNKLLKFQLPELKRDAYKLIVRGLSGLQFYNASALIYKQPESYVRILTAKGQYRPGERVDYRVLFLDETLRSARPADTAYAWCEDAQHIRVKEYRNMRVQNGVYTDKLNIADYAVLGRWRLCVQNGPNVGPSCVYFDVAEYVNPTFRVNIEAPKYVAITKGSVSISVRAFYTDGGPVEGRAYLTMSDYNEQISSTVMPKTRKRTELLVVRGKAKLKLDLKRYKLTHQVASKAITTHLVLSVTVQERFTDLQQRASVDIELHPFSYHIRCRNSGTKCDKYVSDSGRAEIKFSLQHLNGTPVNDVDATAQLIYTPAVYKLNEDIKTNATPSVPKESVVFKGKLNEQGVVSFHILLPVLRTEHNYIFYYRTELAYGGERQLLLGTMAYPLLETKRRAIDANNVDIGVEEPSEVDKRLRGRISMRVGAHAVFVPEHFRAPVNSKVHFTYAAQIPSNELHFIVVARGNILLSKVTKKLPFQKSFVVPLTTSNLMAPSSKLYLHAIDLNNTLRTEEFTFKVDMKYEHRFAIRAPASVSPGSLVNFNIFTAPESFVGLLAVDESALLKRRNNDLTTSELQWLLTLYTTMTPWQGGYSAYPGERSGVITMTNAHFKYERSSMFNKEIRQKEIRSVSRTTKLPQITTTKTNILSDLLRKNFDDVWFFDQIPNIKSIKTTWPKQIPDRITTWQITAFSMHPKYGLALLPEPIRIVSEQSFFVTVKLPYAIKRAEVLQIPVTIFNYFKKSLDVKVVLERNDDAFLLMDQSNKLAPDSNYQKQTRVNAGDTAVVTFTLSPKIIDNIELIFTAKSILSTDKVRHKLKVEAEGLPMQQAAYKLIEVNKTQQEALFNIDLPKQYVPGSERITFIAFGSILKPLIEHINELAKQPSETCEHIISMMVSNLLVLDYLNSTARLKPNWQQLIMRNMEQGYQNLQRYRFTDGSYSNFGPERDQSGSTWLTAFVLLTLHALQHNLSVQLSMLTIGYDFLLSRQTTAGSFVELGTNADMKQFTELELTTYVFLTLSVGMQVGAKLKLNKAFNYIDAHLQADNMTKLSRATLQYARSLHTKQSFLELSTNLSLELNSPTPETTRLERTEAAAFAFLTLLGQDRQNYGNATGLLPLVTWLTMHRESYGSFAGTHESTIDLQALFAYAKRVRFSKSNVSISIHTDAASEVKLFNINENAKQWSIKLPAKTRNVRVIITGTGSLLLQLNYNYNIKVDSTTMPKHQYQITTNLATNTTNFKLKGQVCVLGDSECTSCLAVAEIALPSGYIIDQNALTVIRSINGVKRVESKNADTTINVYILNDSKLTKPICLPISAFRTYAVALQKPATVQVYDLYNRRQRSIHAYNIRTNLIKEEEEEDRTSTFKYIKSFLCDNCRDQVCKNICNLKGK